MIKRKYTSIQVKVRLYFVDILNKFIIKGLFRVLHITCNIKDTRTVMSSVLRLN